MQVDLVLKMKWVYNDDSKTYFQIFLRLKDEQKMGKIQIRGIMKG